MWFIIALIVGAGLAVLIIFIRNRSMRVTWYEWVIGVIGLLLLLFTIQNVTAAYVENEATAALRLLLALGFPALVLLAASWLLVARHNKIT